MPTSLVAAPSGSENLEISIYNTLPFVKVNPWYFSFFSQKSELHFGNLGTCDGIDSKIEDPENGLKAQLTATAAESKSQYEALEKKIEKDFVSTATYNSYIEQTAEDIKLNTESIKKINEAGYITETQAQSMIELQSENITLSVEKNLKIGARNILLDSACFGSFTPAGHNTKKVETSNATDTSVPSGKACKISFNSSIDGISGFYFLNSDIIAQESEIDKIKPNVTYTLSFWAKKNANSGLGNLTKQNVIYAGQNTSVKFDNDRSVFPAISEQWQKYVLTFLIEGTIEYFYIRFLFENCSIYEYLNGTQYSVFISSLKLEEGNIATDWTPSAEDIDQSVKAQIDLCVKTDGNGKLVSEILIESNKLRIETDNFKLDGNGNMTCNGANIKDGYIVCGDESMNMTIYGGFISHKWADSKVGGIRTVYAPLTSGEYAWYECLYGESGIDLSVTDGMSLWIEKNKINLFDRSDEEAKTCMQVSLDGLFLSNKKTFFITEQDSWKCNAQGSSYRSMISVDSALIVSANYGSNGLYLQGNRVYICGALYMDNYYNCTDSPQKMPLYVNTYTGEITI